jgi:hypothetical protein
VLQHVASHSKRRVHAVMAAATTVPPLFSVQLQPPLLPLLQALLLLLLLLLLPHPTSAPLGTTIRPTTVTWYT